MNRRNFIASALFSPLPLAVGLDAAFAQTPIPFIPEANATLEVFRWKRYIEEDEEQYMANVELFTKLTGIKINVKHINILELSWAIDDVYYGRKHADVVLGIDAEAYRYKNLWMQVNDLEKSLTPQTGKWDPIANAYLQANGKDWMGIPLGMAGNSCYQRVSYMKQAGFSKMPEDAAGFLELCKSLKSIGKPAGFALSRQNLPVIDRNECGAVSGVAKGAYVVCEADGTPDVILIATGSEVSVAIAARALLAQEGIKARVVSAPCLEWFEAEGAAYRESILPSAVKARVSVEAGVGAGWREYVGDAGEIVSLDRYGASAAAGVLFKEFGFTPENVAAAAKKSIAKAGGNK